MSKLPPLHPSLLADLTAWLAEFSPMIKNIGRLHYLQGAVRDFSMGTNPNRSNTIEIYSKVVETRTYLCQLDYSWEDGWMSNCNCPAGIYCQHLYATGLTLFDQLADPASKPALLTEATAATPFSTVPPAEAELVACFTARAGGPPDQKTLTYLRKVIAVQQAMLSSYNQTYLTLHPLIPANYRPIFNGYYQNPFADRWSKPPITALEFWSHFALLMEERNVPLPAFMEPITDLSVSRSELATLRREQALATWRARFAELEQQVPPATDAPLPQLQFLRLRLARKKNPVWEISVPAPESAALGAPAPPLRFFPIPHPDLRNLIEDEERMACILEPASAICAAILRTRQTKAVLKLSNQEDLLLLARLLTHRLAHTCVVDDAGRPISRDPRRLVWQFRDDPSDPENTVARLVFADGTPAPSPLLHLPTKPTLYLHENTLYTGLPPLHSNGINRLFDAAEPVPVPRAALALPEAGRFAARAGLALPNDTANRYRAESLRPRLRAQIARRHPELTDEVLVVELTALAPDGTARALFESGEWRRSGPGLPPQPDDHAFLVLDFELTHAAAKQFIRLPHYQEITFPEGLRIHGELTANFPEFFPVWLAGFPSLTLIELGPELAAFAQDATRARFELDLTAGDEANGIDWFDVRVTLRAEDTTLTPAEIALLHGARGRFIRLEGRGWRRLALETSSDTEAKLARLGLDPATAVAETGREPLRFHALQLADEALREALPEKLWAQVRERATHLRSSAIPPIPAGLVADLRPYQHEGFHFLAFLSENRFGGVLADDMGLGKTLQALTWLLWLNDSDLRHGESKKKKKKPFRVLIVCPKSVVVNWQLETARFAPSLTTGTLTPRAEAGLLPKGAHLVVANYAQLRLHAEALAGEAWDAVILDEGQNIKNPLSTTAQAARALRTNCRLVLTGTPIENRLLDLWSLFAFAQPGLLGGQTAFKRLYNDKTDAIGARDRLAQRVKHFLLRRTKSQVAQDLPPRIEKDLEVDLEGPQRALYDAELKRTRQLLLGVKSSREFDSQRFNILQSLLRLRQICCDPRLIMAATPPPPGSASAEVLPTSAKLEALLDTLDPLMAEGHKVLVFSQFVTMLELIQVELKARGIEHLLLTGQTENRQELVEKFQSDPAIPVFLLSLKAAGSGLNLTAASYVVLFDPWWNPAVEAQAIDRTHRIGQKNQVMAYRLIARNTVEEKIRALQKEKAALAAAVVQEESLASVLDLDSLRRILA